eukprot:m51a1_g11018 hypothetical protein (180) ;mRNA; f:397309-397905
MFPRETARLRFALWSEGDFGLAEQLWGDPRVTALIDRRPKLDTSAIRERFDRELGNLSQHSICYYQVWLKETNEFVGVAGLKPCDEKDDAGTVLEIGMQLRPQFWGMGIAREALESVARLAFEERDTAALCARHHPDNARSKKVLLSLGMQRTGEQLYPPTGLIHPVYKLARSQWKQTH